MDEYDDDDGEPPPGTPPTTAAVVARSYRVGRSTSPALVYAAVGSTMHRPASSSSR
jgi:hypothetical protein